MKTKRFLFVLLALLLILTLLAGCQEDDPLARTYNTNVYTEQGGSKLVIASGGELEIQEGATLDLQESPTITLGADELFLIDGATTAQTQTAGALDVNAASVTANTAGIDVLMTANDGTVAATDIFGGRITITNNDADADMFGLKIVSSATTNAAAGSYEYGILYDCAENTAAACSDGLLVTSSGTSTGLTDGVDVSASNIVNGVNVGSNLVLGGNSDYFTIGATDDAFIVSREDSGSVTYSCADDNANATCIYDSGGTGGVIIGTADTVDVVLTAGTALATWSDPPAAGSGGDFLDLTAAFGIANGSDAMIGVDLNLTGAAHTGTGNSTVGIDVDLTTGDAQVPSAAINLNDADWDLAINTGDVPIMSTAATWFDDFVGDILNPTWVLLNGSDGQALDPALAQAQFGTVMLEGGDSNASVAADGSEMALGLHWSADQGSLVMEARVHIDDITTVVTCIGFSDSIALEMPFTIGGSDVITSVADDAIVFCFDTRADTDEWFFIGVDGTTNATGSGATGVAPANGVFQVLRIEVDAGGEDARGYINGTLVGSLTANAVTITDLLSPIAVIQPVVAAVRDLTIDYLYVSAQRQ